MSGNAVAPKVLKGAIVGVDVFMPLASIVIFQYNPETLQRTIKPRFMEDSAAKSEVLRLQGAPDEEIKLDIEIDATDQMNDGNPQATVFGISPQLAALELLAYPKSPLVIANTALMLSGTIEIVPPTGPFALFVWGPQRVLPVRVQELSIAEQMHDPLLNPIRAKVSVGMRVLSYNDLPMSHPGYYVYLANQVYKEVLGNLNSITGVAGAIADLAR
jgi:hypothetical protein